MKSKPWLLFFVLLIIGAYGCKKDGNSTSLVGKWSIVKTVQYSEKDTTISGTASDYSNFAADGGLTIQDHYSGTLTGNYSQTSNGKVGITIYTVDGHGLGVITAPSIYTISYLSNGNIALTSPPYPSGQEIVYLKR